LLAPGGLCLIAVPIVIAQDKLGSSRRGPRLSVYPEAELISREILPDDACVSMASSKEVAWAKVGASLLSCDCIRSKGS
jgi:hypothetical protein